MAPRGSATTLRVLAVLPLLVALAVNLWGTWTRSMTVSLAAQAFIVPAAVLVTLAFRPRWRASLVAAALCYWAGDVFPQWASTDWRDIAMLGLFLVGHAMLVLGTIERISVHDQRGRRSVVVCAAIALLVVVLAVQWAPWLIVWLVLYAAGLGLVTYRFSTWSRVGMVGAFLLVASNVALAVRMMGSYAGRRFAAEGRQAFSSFTIVTYAVGLTLLFLVAMGGLGDPRSYPAVAGPGSTTDDRP